MWWWKNPNKRIENLKSIMADMNRDITDIFHKIELIEVKLRIRAYKNFPKEEKEEKKEAKDFYSSTLLPE